MKISSIPLNITNRLNETSQLIARSLERLSTGKRVNRPRDDLASFSQITRFDSQVRGLNQAKLNINMGRSLLETASSSVSVLTDIVQRMREIAISAGGTSLTMNEREALQTELTSLREEFDRVISSTNFNGLNLLDSSSSSIGLQIGANAGDQIDLEFQNLSSSEVFRKLVPTGEFAAASSTVISGSPERVGTGDFNGDGILDVVVPTAGGYVGMDILLGKGDGTFIVEKITDASNNVQQLDVGDVNGDGILDIVTSDRNDDTVSLYLGNGDGSFQARTTIAQPDFVYQTYLGDVNGDGVLDLVTGMVVAGTNMMGVSIGNGDGTFQAPITTAAAGASGTWRDFQLGDLNGDGLDDVILGSGAFGSPNVQVLISTGTGSFNPTYSSALVGAETNAIAVGDINEDGILDFATLVRSGAIGVPNRLSIFLGDGSGGFTNSASMDLTGFDSIPNEARFGDLDGDGHLDLFHSNQTGGSGLWLGDGQGGFTLSRTFAGTNRAAVIEDFDGDGVLDLAYTNKAGNLFSVALARTTTRAAGSDLSVLSAELSQNLVEILDASLEKLVAAQASLGSQFSRLEYSLSYLDRQSEALGEAKASLESADLSLEIAELVRNQILQQAQTAALVQANANLQMVLELLRY